MTCNNYIVLTTKTSFNHARFWVRVPSGDQNCSEYLQEEKLILKVAMCRTIVTSRAALIAERDKNK